MDADLTSIVKCYIQGYIQYSMTVYIFFASEIHQN